MNTNKDTQNWNRNK